MSRKRLSIGIAAHALDKVVVALVQLFSIPVLANAWGLELFGVWTILMTIPTFLVLGDFGIVNAAAARMVSFVARDEWDAAQATLHTAWLVTILVVGALLVIIAAVVLMLPVSIFPTAAGLGEDADRLIVILLLSYGLLTILSRLNAASYRATLRYTLASLSGTVSYLVENLAVVVIAAAKGGPLAAAVALVVLRIMSSLGLVVLSHRLLPRLRPGFSCASKAEWRKLWRPALAASAFGFGVAGYLQGSVVVLGLMAGAAAVPAFVAVRTLSRLGVQMGNMISLPVSQEFASAMGRGDLFRSGRLFGLVLVIALATALAMGVGLAALGRPFVFHWTHGAITADQSLILFMALSSTAAVLWSPFSNFILSMNMHHSYSYANVVASVAGLGVIFLFAGQMGAAAAGLSFFLVDLVTFLAVLGFIWRHWAGLPQFQAGVVASAREITNPRALYRALRGRSAKSSGT